MRSRQRRSSYARRVALLVILVTLLAASMPSTAATSDVHDKDKLYFTKETDERLGGMTAIPPEAGEPVPVVPESYIYDHIIWTFALDGTPENWTPEAGSSVKASVFFGRLENIYLPTHDPTQQEDPTKIKIDLLVFEHRSTVETVHPYPNLVEEEDIALASARVFVDPPILGGESSPKIEFDAPIKRSYEVDKSHTIYVELVITGVSTIHAEPVIFLGAPDTASFVTIPGYPVDLLRIQEEHALAETDCNQMILRGEPCVGAQAPDSGESAEAPGASIHLIMSVLVAFVIARRRLRETGPNQQPVRSSNLAAGNAPSLLPKSGP